MCKHGIDWGLCLVCYIRAAERAGVPADESTLLGYSQAMQEKFGVTKRLRKDLKRALAVARTWKGRFEKLEWCYDESHRRRSSI